MRSVRQAETKPEKRIREELLLRGLQLSASTRPIAEIRMTADFVFAAERVCVFIDGCFWHGCPEHFKLPFTNSAWWKEKVSETAARDRRQTLKLDEVGWTVVRIWEHENPREAVERILAVLIAR